MAHRTEPDDVGDLLMALRSAKHIQDIQVIEKRIEAHTLALDDNDKSRLSLATELAKANIERIAEMQELDSQDEPQLLGLVRTTPSDDIDFGTPSQDAARLIAMMEEFERPTGHEVALIACINPDCNHSPQVTHQFCSVCGEKLST